MKSPDSQFQQPQQPPQEEPISPEEAEVIKKEMFMTGGGVKAGQTMEQYRAEREGLWEKQQKNNRGVDREEEKEDPVLAQKQAERRVADQTKANEIRSSLGVPEKPIESKAIPVAEHRAETK